MPRSFSNPARKILVLAIVCMGSEASAAAPFFKDVCRQGRPLSRISVSYQAPIPRPAAGTPLDDALEEQELAVRRLRAEASSWFIDHAHPTLDRLRFRYTLLYPARVRDELNLGPPIARSDTWIAVNYRRLLWREYLERFTRVLEAPGKTPDSLRFKVSLDLRLFCLYRQRVEDLVTRD